MQKWKLLEPLKLGNLVLRNRIVMAPIENHLNNADGSVSEKLIDYYVERARNGVSTIIVQHTHVNNTSSSLSQLGIHNDNMITGLSDLAEAIQANGAIAIIQIGHGGLQCNPHVIDTQPIAPSAYLSITGLTSREMTNAEIQEIEDDFAEAARRAKQAGFDGVELHGAHGYLLCQFLSPNTNRRNDMYGGSIENRARFALEIIEKVRAKVGKDFLVGYRISADEYLPHGLKLNEAKQAVKMFEAAGISYIHVSAATYESGWHTCPNNYMEKAPLVNLAAGIKKVVKIPVITVAAHTIETGEQALRKGKADMVAFGRGLLADPEIAKKLTEGRIKDIRPCLRSNEPCAARFNTGQPIRCEVNPACGKETEFKITQADIKKKIVVIGGGIAGMEAARVAALRGHEVSLFEKTDRLGGHLLAASVQDFKKEIKQLLDWAIYQVGKGNIRVKLNTEVTPRLIKKLTPEVLIVAVGSDYLIPQIPGSDKTNFVTANEALLGKKTIGKNIVILGGELVGCETAIYLASQNKKVTVTRRSAEMVLKMEHSSRDIVLDHLKKLGVTLMPGVKYKEITSKGLVVTNKEGQNQELRADTIILATGLHARYDLVNKFKSLAPEVYVIGDCVGDDRLIYNAILDAWQAGIKI